jgi:hypothetical protein
MQAGALVFSPVVQSHPLTGYGVSTAWDDWERSDRVHLTHCTELLVLLLDGWPASVGCPGRDRDRNRPRPANPVRDTRRPPTSASVGPCREGDATLMKSTFHKETPARRERRSPRGQTQRVAHPRNDQDVHIAREMHPLCVHPCGRENSTDLRRAPTLARVASEERRRAPCRTARTERDVRQRVGRGAERGADPARNPMVPPT